MTAANAITLATDREPWARQPRESEKQYVAFQAFLNQEPPRSIERLAKELGKNGPGHLYQWSSANKWMDRVIHYDGYIRRSQDQALMAQRKEMNERHANLAKAMSAKVAQRIQTLQPEELSPGELGRWMQVLSMVERLALGEGSLVPDTNVQVNVGVQVNSQPDPVVDLAHVGEVLDRLAALNIIPEPLAIEEGEVVDADDDD